jgi:phosphate transport system permease protein
MWTLPADAERRRAERLARGALAGAAALAALPSALILGLLIVKGAPALSWAYLSSAPSAGMTAGGLLPALVGTAWLCGVSLGFSVPVGVLAGVYLAEYAEEGWLTRVIDAAILNLAGVPSIVHALFGLGAFVLALELGTSIWAAGLTLGVMTLPVLITSTQAALRSVPQVYRVACWNLGATRWQTVRHVVLPQALPGILTGVILQVSRAAGETAPVLFTGAAFYLPVVADRPDMQTMALAMHVFAVVTQIPDVPTPMKYGAALTLVLGVLCVNAAAIVLRARLRGAGRS